MKSADVIAREYIIASDSSGISSTLDGAVNTTDLTWTLTDGSGFTANTILVVKCESELCLATISGNTLTIQGGTRGGGHVEESGWGEVVVATAAGDRDVEQLLGDEGRLDQDQLAGSTNGERIEESLEGRRLLLPRGRYSARSSGGRHGLTPSGLYRA